MEESKVIRLNQDEEVGTTVAPETDIVADEQIGMDKAISLLNLQGQLQDMKDMRGNIVKEQLKVLGDVADLEAVQAKLVDISIEDLKAITEEGLKELFTINGKEVDVAVEIEDAFKAFEFKRDFLVYLKESEQAVNQIDEAVLKLEEDLKAHDEELKDVVAQFGDLSKCIRAKLLSNLENAGDAVRAKRAQRMLDSFDDAWNLTRIYEIHKVSRPGNVLRDYKDNDRSVALYKNYMKAIARLGLKSDLTAFNDLEIKFLPEKYHKYPNLFLFIVIRYFAYKKDVADRVSDGVFLSQFMVYVKTLFADRFTTPEEKEEFLQNIQRVLDLYY